MPSCWFLLWLLVFNFRYSNSACGYLSDKYGNPIRLSIELETILGIRFSKIVSIFIYLWRCITIAHYSLVAVVLFRTDIVHFVPAGPDTATLMSTAAQCSGTRHRTLTDTIIGAGQGRIIMKEAFLTVGYENCIILIKFCQHQDIGGRVALLLLKVVHHRHTYATGSTQLIARKSKKTI